MSDALNKTARRESERQAREAERIASVELEPSFPFTVVEFDPAFFGVSANPPEKVEPDE